MRGVEGTLKLKLSSDKNQVPLSSRAGSQCHIDAELGVWVNKSSLRALRFGGDLGGFLPSGLPLWLVMKA